MSIILFASIFRPCYCYLLFMGTRTRIRILPFTLTNVNIQHIRASATAWSWWLSFLLLSILLILLLSLFLCILKSNDASDHVLMVRNLWKYLQRFIGIQTWTFYIRLVCVRTIYKKKNNNNYIQLIDRSAIYSSVNTEKIKNKCVTKYSKAFYMMHTFSCRAAL